MNLLRTLICLFLINIYLNGNAQTFDCYIANDHLTSATVYEFDVYIISTGGMFNLRSVQNCFTFNPAFVDPAANVTVTLVPGSTQMNSYNVANLQWSATAPGFQTSANTGGTCQTGTLITTTNAIRIGTFRMESSIAFNCAPANPSMVVPGTANPPGLVLKMAISKWNTLDCSSGLTSNITANGTYTQYNPLTNYSHVQNMVPLITAQPNNASACNGGLVTFTVAVTPNSGIATPVSYQWLENGVPVSNGSTANGTYAGATTATLTITNPSVNLAGHQFSCVISQCNSDTTVSVIITSSSNDNNACTVDACDPATGIVTNTPVNTDDGNSCTADACDPATGTITHTAVNTNDGDGCTTDGCDPVTGVFHTPVNTNDNNPCTADACDPATGSITHAPVQTNDSNACTVDGCDPVTGIYHTALNTNDNDHCTTDACDPATGNVTHTPVTTDDGNACTTDGCDPATGVYHTPVNIDDGNSCTIDHCNNFTGAINHVPVNTDDGNACTTDGCDVVTGVYHNPVNVDDGIACTLDECDTVTGSITHSNITSASPALSVSNNCGNSVITASGFTGSLLWSTGETTASITVTNGGIFTVTQTISGCTSPPGTISAAPLTVPSVNLGNDTLVQSGNYTLDAGPGFLSYLWSTGATTQSINVQSSGWFWVTVTNSTCPGTDSVFVDFFLGVDQLNASNDLLIYPNPNVGDFTVALNSIPRNAMIEIINASGMLVYKSPSSPSGRLQQIHLDVENGCYILKFTSSDATYIRPFTIVK